MVLAQDYCNTLLTLRGGGVKYVNSIAISVDRENGMQGQQSSQSSFVAMIYEELIPSNHLLRWLSPAVDFSSVPDLVSDCYSPDNGRRTRACSTGSPGPPHAIQSRFLEFPCDFSERNVEEQINLHVACSRRVRLGWSEPGTRRWHCRGDTAGYARCL